MSSKESAKFWHAKCQELEAKVEKLSYDAKYWKAEYQNLFTRINKCLLGVEDEEVQVNTAVVNKALRFKGVEDDV
jgi:hypothetical protein